MQANGALQASPARAHQEKEYTLREAVDILLEAKTGGFTAVATSVDGADKLDPAKSARRQMFLTEDRNAAARLRLRNRLIAWRDLLSKSDNPGEMAETCRETVQKSAALLLRNLREAVRAGKNLERAYRNLDLFFKNAGKASIRNLTLMNASPEQLRNLSSPRFIHAVRDELTARFDKLDLRGNYSLLVVPGYLGSKKVLNVGFGFYNHKNASLYKTSGEQRDSVYQNQTAIGADVYLDMPLNKTKGSALSVLATYYNYNFGTNYIRNLGILNLHQTAATLPDSWAGGGNAQPTIGTGSIFYVQAGYQLPKLKNGTAFMPYVTMTHKDFERLADPSTQFGLGLNYFVTGHNAKITLEYQTRPVYKLEGDAINRTGYKGELILQTHIFL